MTRALISMDDTSASLSGVSLSRICASSLMSRSPASQFGPRARREIARALLFGTASLEGEFPKSMLSALTSMKIARAFRFGTPLIEVGPPLFLFIAPLN